MPYSFSHLPEIGDVSELRRYMEDELKKISEAFNEQDSVELRASRHAPDNPREGMIIHADGLAWDPGSGAGTYRYQSGVWVKIPSPADIPVVTRPITLVGDADYTILSTDRNVFTNAALTANRTWTLPAASAIQPHQEILVFDRKLATSLTNKLIVQRAGADTIDDVLTSVTFPGVGLGLRCISDGVSKWAAIWEFINQSSMLENISATRGAILYRGSTGWTALAPNTAGFVLTDAGAGADPSYQAASSGILQCLQATYTTNTNLSTQIPQDDTTPTSTEGTEVLSKTITPADNTNKVLVLVHLWGAVSTGSNPIAVAVFRGTTCIQAALHYQGTANFPESVSCAILDSPASASAQTYSVRVGPAAAINVRLNGSTVGRFFGGTSAATLTVMEVAA